MSGQATHDDRIVFRLTDTDLWVGNSGRPLDEDDVKGLCGIGASSKGEITSRRRASIGHKGMGFKSVLEITATPEIVSDDYAFRMAADFAREPIDRAHGGARREQADTRAGYAVSVQPSRRHRSIGASSARPGIRTLFRFPLRPELTDEQRSLLADRLLALPVTTILFLKHLERVDVSVETERRREGFSWSVRTRAMDGRWLGVVSPGSRKPGSTEIHVVSASGETHDFLLAHDADVEIGEHRGGLDTYAWEGIEVSEVSVAALLEDDAPAPNFPPHWRHFHVFLPTAEPCPYPLLVNGAFVSDLSRQEVRVGEERDDYNRFLMRRVAALFRDVLAPHLQRRAYQRRRCFSCLIARRRRRAPRLRPRPDRRSTKRCATNWQRIRSSHAKAAERLALNQCVVPPLVPAASVGEQFRKLLPDEAAHDGSLLPGAEPLPFGCRPDRRRPRRGLALSTRSGQRARSGPIWRESSWRSTRPAALHVDPVLRVLQGLWEGLDWADRDEFAAAVRHEPPLSDRRRERRRPTRRHRRRRLLLSASKPEGHGPA